MSRTAMPVKQQLLVGACVLLYCLHSGPLEAKKLCWTEPNCECSGPKDKVNIYCPSVWEVSHVAELFRRSTPVNRIRLRGNFTTISNGSFDGITVSDLRIEAPLGQDIPPLLGVHNLTELNLTHTSFLTIPDAFANNPFYKKFNLTQGNLTEVTTQLQNMSSATHINLSGNRLSSIAADAFDGTWKINMLDLSHNELKSFHSDIFKNVARLNNLFLQHNYLVALDGRFRSINPKKINLYSNNLKSFHNVLHGGMKKLEYLNIGANPQANVSGLVFSNLTSLKHLHMTDNRYTWLDPNLVRGLGKLISVYLNRNELESLPELFFESNTALNVLELSDNRLISIEHCLYKRKVSKKNAMTLKLDGNRMERVRLNNSIGKIQIADLSRNRIEHIETEDMLPLKDVNLLNLSRNGLSSLGRSNFSFYKLHTLDLSHNHLRLLGETFLNLKTLFNIHLRNNSLQSVYGAFRYMKKISSLDLASNNLTTLTVDSFPEIERTSVRVRFLRMADNPWSCDCRLSWLPAWIGRQGSSLEDEPLCQSPEHLRNRTLRSLNKTDYETWLDRCPGSCRCKCVPEGDLVHTEVNCDGAGMGEVPEPLPYNVRLLDLRGNAMRSFNGSRLQEYRDLRELNLENNNIEELLADLLPSGLTSLWLANNRLHVFPLLDQWNDTSLRRISLKENPWVCNCDDTWPFRNWLVQNNESVVDVEDVLCSDEQSSSLRNKRILHLTFDELCSHSYFYLVLSVISGLLLILCLVALIGRHSVVALLYSWGCGCFKKTETHDCPYDAFLIYSEVDEQLVLGLENQMRNQFSLCIPSRDIAPPRSQQQLNTYFPQCSKVMVILTKSLVESRQCMRILTSAMSFMTEKNIVFIVLGQMPPKENMDPLLKTLVRSCKRLKWGERLFWQKLAYHLPRRGARRKSLQEDT